MSVCMCRERLEKCGREEGRVHACVCIREMGRLEEMFMGMGTDVVEGGSRVEFKNVYI